MSRLVVRGAKQHNLKNVDVVLPRNKLVVITGPSGSGKSSLAFDTIYAEGQRRYVESLSAYARQFLEQLAKPAVDAIEGLSPAIAIEQRALAKSPRSTVGTVTEVADYLRLLFARVGTPHCPKCGKRIEAQTAEQIVDRILALGEGERVSLLAPVVRRRRGELKLEIERLRREGFVRVRIDGEVVDLGDEIVLDRSKSHDLDVVVDRIVIKDGVKGRLTDSVELALKLGEGVLLCDRGGVSDKQPAEKREPIWMSERFACVECGVSLPPIEPRMFSFNGPHGACPVCDGIGTRSGIDADRLVPDPKRTLREGAVAAWGKRGTVTLATEVDRAVKALGVDPDSPWSKLSDDAKRAILHGDDGKGGRGKKRVPYEGILARLERRLESGDLETPEDDDEDDLREAEDLGRFVVTKTCDGCEGRRLRPESLAVRLGELDIAEVGRLPLHEVQRFMLGLLDPAVTMLPARQRPIADPLIRAVVARLGFLIDVGLAT
jgi:excinuclease ABC subunit A